MSVASHAYRIYIRCTPRAAWSALVEGDATQHYYYGTVVKSEFIVGASVVYEYPDGTIAADGRIIAIEPLLRLELSFHPRWDHELESEGPVRMVWTLTQVGDTTLLSAEFFDAEPDTKTYQEFVNGLPYICSGLKTLLETGDAMA